MHSTFTIYIITSNNALFFDNDLAQHLILMHTLKTMTI